MIKIRVEFKSGKVEVLSILLSDYTANLVWLADRSDLVSIRILD